MADKSEYVERRIRHFECLECGYESDITPDEYNNSPIPYRYDGELNGYVGSCPNCGSNTFVCDDDE